MMAAAGRESHRSAEKNLLSPPLGATPQNGGVRSYSKDESVVCDGSVDMGTAGLEAEIGNVDALFKTKSEQPKRAKKGNLPFKGGGKKNNPGGRETKTAPRTESSTAAAAEARGGGVDANKAPTRERSQHLYEIYRQTQVCEGDRAQSFAPPIKQMCADFYLCRK